MVGKVQKHGKTPAVKRKKPAKVPDEDAFHWSDDDFYYVEAAKKEGEQYVFKPYKSQDKDLIALFRPNRSPREVFQAGSFGGTYWRPIESFGKWKDVHKEFDDWFGDIRADKLTRKWSDYAVAINKYGVKCGQTLEEWHASNWIKSQDPYGWFQWYCRFFKGRRSADDARQIGRWLNSAGASGRFRSQLINRCKMQGTTYNNYSVSPVIRQTLLHWAYELTPSDFDNSEELKKKAMAARKALKGK